MIKRLLIPACLLTGLLLATPAMGQDEPEPAAEEAVEAVEAVEASAAEGTDAAADSPLGTSIGGDLDFNKMSAENIQYSSEGELRMAGNVVFESDQLNLKSANLLLNPDTQLMVATGSPVEIMQGEVRAECQNFHYDMEKKVSRLTGTPSDRPFIIQKQASGDLIKTIADVIIITQGEGGKTGINLQMDKNSNRTPEIVKIPKTPAASTTTQAKATPARRVKDTNLDIIKLPELD